MYQQSMFRSKMLNITKVSDENFHFLQLKKKISAYCMGLFRNVRRFVPFKVNAICSKSSSAFVNCVFILYFYILETNMI